jgi:hypothetical protein
MPDPALSAALREAYASAPDDAVVLHTIELWHPAFSLPIRVVRDWAALDARLEADAPRDAGALVTFTGYPFEVLPPDQQFEALPEVRIEIDNVSRDILAEIDRAVLDDRPVELIYRQYLAATATDGPETDPPLVLELSRISATPLRITATAGFPVLADLRFPRLAYDLNTFPGLQP